MIGKSLIVNPGSEKASLAALDLNTGRVVWTAAPEDPSAYGSFVSLSFAGERQIVGCDAHGLAGWDPATGIRLWSLPDEGEAYHAPSPVAWDGHLVLGDAEVASYSHPALAARHLFMRSDRELICLKLDSD